MNALRFATLTAGLCIAGALLPLGLHTGSSARAAETQWQASTGFDSQSALIGSSFSAQDQSTSDGDDARPYRRQYRQFDGRGPGAGLGGGPGRGTGAGPGGGPSCAGYVDDDKDGICDHCGRTTTGCPRAPGATTTRGVYPDLPTAQHYESQSTLENMQAAFQGESNAQAKYLAFAAKADEEGYAGVASLFRAAAAAEGIHAENHAEVIRQLGAKAVATIAEVKVATTRENLETAISGESYEWDVMYPGMINRARRDRERAAIRSFNFAMTAERSHATFYRAALADMDSWKSKRDFFVCGVCGETVAQLDFTKCPSCFSPVKEYRKVN